jgi:ribosomal protein L39E
VREIDTQPLYVLEVADDDFIDSDAAKRNRRAGPIELFAKDGGSDCRFFCLEHEVSNSPVPAFVRAKVITEERGRYTYERRNYDNQEIGRSHIERLVRPHSRGLAVFRMIW